MLQWNRILNALERVCVFGETNRQTERHTERGGKQVQLFHCQVYVSTLHALYAYYAQSSWIFNHVDPIFGMLKRKVEGKCRARSIFCVCKRALLASSWEFVFRIFRLSFCCFAFRHIWRVRDYWDCLNSFFFLYFSFINLLFIIFSQSDSTYLRLEFTCHNKLSTRSHIAWESSFSCAYFFFLLFFSFSILSVITQHLFDWKWKTSVRKKERKRIADAVFASMSSFW